MKVRPHARQHRRSDIQPAAVVIVPTQARKAQGPGPENWRQKRSMRHMKAPHASPCLVREAWELLQAPPGEGQGPAVLGWQVQVVALLQEEATAFATWQAAKNGDNAFCVEEVHLPGGGEHALCLTTQEMGAVTQLWLLSFSSCSCCRPWTPSVPQLPDCCPREACE